MRFANWTVQKQAQITSVPSFQSSSHFPFASCSFNKANYLRPEIEVRLQIRAIKDFLRIFYTTVSDAFAAPLYSTGSQAVPQRIFRKIKKSITA